MHYKKHLSKDKHMKALIRKHGVIELNTNKNICMLLCRSIMSQQLSTKVADVLHQRFMKLFKTRNPKPEDILNIRPEVLRSIGLSNNKVSYVHNVARFALEQGLNFNKLNSMSDEEVIAHLTQIKGVGRWTVEMLLMFHLGREDVFSSGDLGIQTAMKQLYNIRSKDKKSLAKRMEQVSKAWSPYRTFACMYLWMHKDSD